MHDFDQDIDPERNFFNNIKINCEYYTEEKVNDELRKDGTNRFSIIHFNGRSLYANFEHIKDYLSQFTTPFSVIAISESWIKESKGVADIQLDGYDFKHMNRMNKGGGGTALYIQNHLKFKVVEEMSIAIKGLCECITVEIFMEGQKNILVSCVYRAPTSNIVTFRDTIEELLIKTEQKVTFFCGDFNINLLNPQVLTDGFTEAMYNMGLYPVINKPSRITTHSASLIDNIFTNNIYNNLLSGLLMNDITDHLPVFVMFDCEGQTKRDTMTRPSNSRRLRTDEAIEAFKYELAIEKWREVYEATDVDEAYGGFLNKFLVLFDRSCPVLQQVKWGKKSKTPHKPWISKGILNACKKKNSLYRDFIKHRSSEKEIKYKRYKNKLIDIIRKCKKEYYNNLLENNKNDSKGTWNIINKIIRKSTNKPSYPNYFTEKEKDITNMDDVVEGFNTFFVSVGPDLAEKIKPPQGGANSKHKIDRNSSTIFLHDVTRIEIIDVVKNFKNKASIDENGIDMALIKKVIGEIVDPITHICNLSFKLGTFPTEMKTAKIIPIYKTGDKHLYTNYRPISLLPQFSKILEKLFVARLDSFIEKHNILIEGQYGFRTNRSTSMALTEVVEELTNSIDNKEYAIGVFIDLKKAFDTINHDILLHKLERYGIRGIGLSWIRSYIQNRKQFVQIGDYRSSCLNISCGVPQGSVLGPKLFILYINDIVMVSDILKYVVFADDTNIFCSGKDIQQLLQVITAELENLKRWFDSNKLSLNINKSKFILFGNKKVNPSTLVELSIENVKLERVQQYTFLGVKIDQNLSWKSHINHVRSKTARTLGILRKTRYGLNLRSLFLIYCTLLLPYLTYCVETWGNTYKTNLNPLSIMQKKAIRIVHNMGYTHHTNKLFLKSKTLKLLDIVELKTTQIVYKARNNLLPGNLQKLFKEREGRYEYRHALNFQQPKARTTLKGMCISVQGVKLWNGLPDEIKISKNIYYFKKMFIKSKLEEYGQILDA